MLPPPQKKTMTGAGVKGRLAVILPPTLFQPPEQETRESWVQILPGARIFSDLGMVFTGLIFCCMTFSRTRLQRFRCTGVTARCERKLTGFILEADYHILEQPQRPVQVSAPAEDAGHETIGQIFARSDN